MPETAIRIEPLGEGRRILVSDAHRFGTDAFLLANFADPHRDWNAVDLGTGCGIIPTLWLGKGCVRTCLGIEISEEACELARKTAKINDDTLRFEVLQLDLRELRCDGSGSKYEIDRERFDLVVCNPPYFIEQSGYVSPDPQRARARSELSCSVEDVCEAARYLLRYGGRLCMCHRPERLPDVICAMRAKGIEPKRMRMIQQRPEKAPWLVLIEGRRGAGKQLDILPPMFMQKEDGSPSDELEAMYGCYRDGRAGK